MALEIRQNERYQRAEWRFERVGWVLISLFLLAGLVGLLGTGPLSQTRARSGQGLVEAEYQRVTHHMADDSVTLTFSADAVEGGTLTFELTGGWVSGINRTGITPAPTEERAVPGGLVLELPVERPGDSQVLITYRAQDYGSLSAEVAVRGDRLSFSQFVLP